MIWQRNEAPVICVQALAYIQLPLSKLSLSLNISIELHIVKFWWELGVARLVQMIYDASRVGFRRGCKSKLDRDEEERLVIVDA